MFPVSLLRRTGWVAALILAARGLANAQQTPAAPTASLTGIVRDSSGKPIAGVGLSVSPWTGVRTMRYDSRQAVTAAAGRDRLDHLAVGTPLMIDVIQRDDLEGEQVVNLSPGLQTQDLILKPRPDGGSVAGVVFDPAGKPMSGAEVINRRDHSVEHRRTTTGPDGRFALANLHDNIYNGKNLLIQAPGFALQRVLVKPDPAGP